MLRIYSVLHPRTFLLLGLLLLSQPAFAQEEASVSGYITDVTSGETLLMANVVVEGSTTGAATNNAGYYVLSGLEPGTHTLVASYLGYEPVRQEVTLSAGEQRRLDFELPPTDVTMEEVVISADAAPEDRTAVGAMKMPVAMTTEMPAILTADVFRSLQMMPGIKAASDFSSGLYIRGGSPDQTLIMLDRTVVYNPTHVFGFFSTFNPDALKDVQVYKGGFGAEYGGRLGSVIDVYNKDGNRDHMEGSLTLGLLASRAHVEGPYSRGSYMLAVRRSTIEPLLAVLRQSQDGIPDAFYFYDINGKINLDVGDRDRVSLAGYGGTDKLLIVPSEDLDVEMVYGNRTASLGWNHLFSGRFFSNFTFTTSRYFSLPVFDAGGTEFARRNRVYDTSLKADLEYVPSQRHTFEAGIWAGNMTLKLKDLFDGTVTLNSRNRTYYGSAYIQDTWRPSYAWSVRAGLRTSAFGEGGYIRLEPRLSLEHRSSESVRFQLAYGRYYQYLTLVTNETFSGLDIWLTADEGVPPAWGDQFVFGVKTSPRRGLRVDGEVFYRSMEDLFEIDPDVGDASGRDYAELFRFGDGYAYGAELMVTKQTGKLNGFLGYTYGHTRRRYPGFNLDADGDPRFYPPKYDRTHDVSLVANYDLTDHWRTTAVFAYATGQAYTLPLGRTEYGLPFDDDPVDELIVGRVNASRLPAYHRLDLGVTRIGRFFGIADYELQVQVVNVYNRRNVWFYNYDFAENPVALDTVRMLPIIPNVSFTLDF